MKKLLFTLLLLVTPAWCTITLVHTTTNNSCSGATTCVITLSANFTSGNGAVVMMQNGTTGTTTSSFNTGCTASWTEVPATRQSATGIGAADASYCTNVTGGVGSVTITISTTFASGNVTIWEFSSSLGGIALDSGATPGNIQNNSANCTACTGVTLVLSGNNNFIAFVGLSGGTCSAVTGTGMTLDNNDHGNCEGHGITSGSLTAPTTFTQTSGQNFGTALAMMESSGVSVKSMVPTVE